ncbi:fungal-specific transcription factor domain-containing protein [Penicillium antarcticum]|uniref:fungal-specific transcription factor domain-containing protein n=1 Tax=Penicillium antarcticum TaxID=416450 RepID=UPI00238A54F2|nr:fungal-specific transcription factor domain-containing protein [Penicillium antarcticum]KAJ5297579.1 fungal-specific transcription factor domain-containing protein [Penicillium antarcticum]
MKGPVGDDDEQNRSDEHLMTQPRMELIAPDQMEPGLMTGNMLAPLSPSHSTPIDQQPPMIPAPGDGLQNSQMTPLTSLFSLETGDDWRGSSQSALWDCQPDQDWDALLTGELFDLDAVNMTLLNEASEHFPALQTPPEIPAGRPQRLGQTCDEHVGQRQYDSLLQRKWHTFCEFVSSSGQMTPVVHQEGHDINDAYRERLAERLQPSVPSGILPSTTFLDLCIQTYFSKFHALFPVVHMPTFRPGIQNSILLLSICSIGSLFIGSTRALAHGVSMFERLNKAILASWDTYLSTPGYTSTIALQASLIGQTFGLLVGRPKDLFGIEIFHGSLIAWARKAKLFHSRHADSNILDLDGDELQDAWSSWIKTEVNMRIVLGLHIHDAELARIHHHEPLLRHSLSRLPQISSNELFAASTAIHWKSLMAENQSRQPTTSCSQQSSANTRSRSQSRFHNNPTSTPGDFALSGMLESISALSSEGNTSITECRALLTTWHVDYAPKAQSKPSWRNLMILWHSIFIALHADFNAIEIACDRDGHEAAQKSSPYVRSWVRSADAKRCILHAMLIQKNFESLPAGAESAIHVPLCLYYCGLVWACFACFSDKDEEPVTVDSTDNFHFEELLLEGIDGVGILPEQSSVLLPRRLALGSLFRIIDLLQRVSHWRISQSLASTLLAIVDETQDLF